MATKKSRKNPRAQVALLARYRSPTVFEFVNEECFDLSAGGMFIKSEAPAPVGTLLKLECVVDNGVDTLRGVARVVWLRERESEGQPAGMGVKFVKLEPGSREIIHRILVERGSIVPEAPVMSDPPGAPLSRPPSIVPIKLALGTNGAGPAHGELEASQRSAGTVPMTEARASASQPAPEVHAASAPRSSLTPLGGSGTTPTLRGSSLFPSSSPPASNAAASQALSSEPPAPRAAAPMAVLLAAEAQQPAVAREPKAVDSARPASAKRPSARPSARKPAPAPARPSQRGPALAVLGLGVVAFVGAIAFALSQPKPTPSPAVTREVPQPSAAAPTPIEPPPQAPQPPAAEPEAPAPAAAAAAIAPEPSPAPAAVTATATPEPATPAPATPEPPKHQRPAAEPAGEEHEHHHHGHEADTAATQALNEQLAREAAAANAPAAVVPSAVPAVPAAAPAANPGAAPAAPAATPAANPVALEAAAAAQSNVSATAEAARPAAPTSYVLQVVTTPGGAQVTAAGQSGVSPCSLELGTLDGPVEVRASLAGYEPAAATIDRIGFMLDDGRMRRRISLSLHELPKPLPEPEPVAKPSHHHPRGAIAPAASPAAADKPASPAAPSASPMETAMKCLSAGDNACVVSALEGKTRSAQELELLIETYRTLGNTRKAESWMQTYLDKYPTERRAATYRRQLERRQAENAAAP